jgi:hypothetical protein
LEYVRPPFADEGSILALAGCDRPRQAGTMLPHISTRLPDWNRAPDLTGPLDRHERRALLASRFIANGLAPGRAMLMECLFDGGAPSIHRPLNLASSYDAGGVRFAGRAEQCERRWCGALQRDGATPLPASPHELAQNGVLK